MIDGVRLDGKASHGGFSGPLIGKMIFGMVINTAIFCALLFLPAGTWVWPRAWVFFGVTFIGTAATILYAFRGNEELLRERMKPPIQPGQPLADKILVLLFIAAYFAQIAFIPIDVFRLHLLPRPPEAVSLLGLILVMAGWWIITFVFRANAFAMLVVKHQAERHHVVIDRGPYAIVRHPMYAGVSLFMIGLPLWLQSYPGALAALIPIAILMLRIGAEENFLKRELAGYEDYAKRVRYRLIPYLW